MKAVIYHFHNDIRIEQRAIPVISDDELLIHVHGYELCGPDMIKIALQAPPPAKLRHKLTGTIVQYGCHVNTFREGERVIIAHHIPCGICHYCRHQNYSMCATFKESNLDPCGLAEYTRVPAAHVQQTTLSLPAALSDEASSFTELLSCCVRAVRRTPQLNGDTAVIMGLGSIGLLMLQAAFKELNKRARRRICIYSVDLVPGRLQLARDLGAHSAFPVLLRDLLGPQTEGRADSIILAVAGTHPFLQVLAGVRKGGFLHVFAAHTGSALINIATIYQQELSIISTYSSSPEDLRTALDLPISDEVRVERLISHRLPPEEFHEGATMMRERAALKKIYFQIAGEIHGK